MAISNDGHTFIIFLYCANGSSMFKGLYVNVFIIRRDKVRYLRVIRRNLIKMTFNDNRMFLVANRLMNVNVSFVSTTVLYIGGILRNNVQSVKSRICTPITRLRRANLNFFIPTVGMDITRSYVCLICRVGEGITTIVIMDARIIIVSSNPGAIIQRSSSMSMGPIDVVIRDSLTFVRFIRRMIRTFFRLNTSVLIFHDHM